MKSALCAFAIFHGGPWGLKAKIKCFLRTTNSFNGVGIRNTLFNFFGPCVFKHHRVPVFSYHVSNVFCNGLRTLFSVADTVHFHLPRLMGGKKHAINSSKFQFIILILLRKHFENRLLKGND